MAEALVSVLLEQLASIIHQQVEQHVKLVVNVEKDVANLTHNFRAIEAVLKDAEERQVKEASVKLWLDDLKDVSNEMEDVLDDWNTEILRLHIEKQEKEESGNAVDTTKKKVCLCIPTAFFCSGQVSRVIYRHDIAQKIKDLNERLATIANRRQNYNFQYTKSGTEHVERQKTTSFVDQTFGRVDEKELLVAKLLSKSNPEGQSPLVIPIVGMGGIGKTTLSQLAYNDDRVKANFTKRNWVCVSEPFDELNIAKDIIGQLDRNVNSISNNLEACFQCVHKSIEGEKFLLVLDDVWNQDYRKWEKLKLLLQNGDVGSKIVVTTRKEEVARMMGAADNTINLKVLSDENCWLLFTRIAFTNRNQDECKILEPIGREIVKKCKGLPLVAKTLGGLMSYKKTKKEWQDVLSNEIWELDTLFEQQVFPPLLLSYYDLTPILKCCLLYCVTFPKDHIIDKKNLIELWMSQSYLGSITEKTTVNIGDSYFNNLVMRSFFQDFVKDKFGNIKRCKMHDIVHDFLQFLTKNECSVLDVQGKTKVEVPVGNKFRHLTITSARDGPFSVCFDRRRSLRTLATFSCRITSLDREFVSQLKCVRTLNLRDNGVEELPEEVGGLVHLRYLDLSCNKWKRLPDTLCNLINLETLRLEKCGGLEELPEGMGKLITLRHLRVKGCDRHMKLPKSIAKLTSLQTLDQVNISHDGSKASDLRNMDQLQGKLEVSWWEPVNDAAKDYAEQANLVNQKHLVSLTLNLWNGTKDSIIQEEMLNALQPNPNLEALKIYNYSGTTFFGEIGVP
ncbi:PREDICTED: putative disease resistance protein RGA4-like [Fragaria vesca subsp. vesca]